MAGGYRNRHANRICVVLLLMLGGSPGVSASDERVQAFPRVRGGTPSVSETISLAAERSPTFQSLVTTIEGTDGIVYVHRGQCGRQVLSCLLLAITKAGDYRMLHIKVDERRRDHDLIVSIAHELRHAIELLSQPNVIDRHTAHNFYHGGPSRGNGYSFETQAAIAAELQVDKELREWRRTRKRVDNATSAEVAPSAKMGRHALVRPVPCPCRAPRLRGVRRRQRLRASDWRRYQSLRSYAGAFIVLGNAT